MHEMYTNKNARFIRRPRDQHFSKQNINCSKSVSSKSVDQVTAFFQFSLIHGFGHITAKHVHPLERVFWVLAVIAAVLGVISINMSNWRRFQENPTVISIERNYKEWNTSFPAITLCPYNKIDQEAITSLALKFGIKNTKEVELFFQALTESTLDSLDKIQPFDKVPSTSYVDIILNSSFKFEFDLITTNLGVNTDIPLWKTRILSEMGVCYSFASKVAKYQDPRDVDYHSTDLLPPLVGNPLDGEVIVQIVNMNTGGKVLFHGDKEVADIVTKRSSVSYLHYKTLGVTAHSIVSSPEIQTLSLQQRKCQYLNEATLQIRPIYTYNLCRMNCRMILSHQLCRCIPHFYWGQKDKRYKLCNASGLKCIASHKDKLVKLQVNHENNCKCFPPCDDTTYNIDEEGEIQWFRGTNLKWGIVKYQKIRFKRDILFGITDLLVATGGCVGFFLGCSLLSFIEIIFCFLQFIFQYLGKWTKLYF